MTSHTESTLGRPEVWRHQRFERQQLEERRRRRQGVGSLEGLHPVIVHSALSGITDRLEQLLAKALTGEWEPVMDQIERRHVDLVRDLGLPLDAELERHFADLRSSAAGIHLIGEVSAACARG